MKFIRKTWLGNLNFWILQWFFIRLCKVVNKNYEIEKYSILKGVIPLTGWWNDYKFIRKEKKWQILEK